MTNTLIKQPGNQRGNALFLILIAVALFAALSYAVTQSGRGGGTVDRETAMITSGQVTQYPAGLRTAVTRMIITGTAADEVDFTTPGTGQTYELFDVAGGGAVAESAPSGTGSTWEYMDATHATDGFYVKDVGTNTSVTGREVFALLQDIPLTICEQILKGLGKASLVPVTAAVTINWAAPLATYNAANANTLSAAGINGEAFLCYDNGGENDYFHVLIEQ